MKNTKTKRNSTFRARVKVAQEHIDFLEGAEQQILAFLDGRDIGTIECLLIHRVLPEARRRAIFRSNTSISDRAHDKTK